MEKISFGSNALKFGLFISAFNIIVSLLYYVFDINMFSTGFMIGNMVVGLAIVVAFFVFGIKSYREKGLDGKITFMQAFTHGLAIGVIGYIIVGIYQYIFNAFIAPEYMQNQLASFIEFMEGFGLPDEALDEAVAGFEENIPPVKQMLQSFKSGAIMSIIVSLIVGASIKKDTTETEIS